MISSAQQDHHIHHAGQEAAPHWDEAELVRWIAKSAEEFLSNECLMEREDKSVYY